MPKSETRFDTPNASKYLQQLCKHFAHKLDVSFTEANGNIELPTGPARLEATAETLLITVEVDDIEKMDRAKNIVEKHLAKFAFRESMKEFVWTS